MPDVRRTLLTARSRHEMPETTSAKRPVGSLDRVKKSTRGDLRHVKTIDSDNSPGRPRSCAEHPEDSGAVVTNTKTPELRWETGAFSQGCGGSRRSSRALS